MKYGDHTLTPHLHRQPPTTPTHSLTCAHVEMAPRLMEAWEASFVFWQPLGARCPCRPLPSANPHSSRSTVPHNSKAAVFVALLLLIMQNTCGNKQHQAVVNLWQLLLFGGVDAERQLVCQKDDDGPSPLHLQL
jgi:hypothetical protein